MNKLKNPADRSGLLLTVLATSTMHYFAVVVLLPVYTNKNYP